MKAKRWARSAVLFVWAAVILSLISSCTAKEDIRAVATASGTGSPSPGNGALATMGPLMSSSEMNMVQFFHFLLALEGAPKTTLSQKQAEAMLPLVNRIVAEGTIGESDMQAMLEGLRPEQRGFYARWIEHKAKPEENPGVDRQEELSEAEKQEWKQEWMKRPVPEHSKNGEEAGSTPDNGHPRPEDDDWTAGEKSVEQQLIGLLESKLGK